MKTKRRNAAHYVLLLLLTAVILLICNGAYIIYLMTRWKSIVPVNKETVLAGVMEDEGTYYFSDDVRAELERTGMFAMIMDDNGYIVCSDRLPDELKHRYTIQDVAKFTRYYLDDHPVHTYVIDQGLLVIGGEKNTVWKYTLEYDEVQTREILFHQLPLSVLINLSVLIGVPLLIQRKWLRQKESVRTEWIAGVSHDIRTPLTLILGNADSISAICNDEGIKAKVEVISSQGRKIKSLITNLNTSSKLDYAMGAYEKVKTPLVPVLREKVSEIINLCNDDRYEFSFDADESLWYSEAMINRELFDRSIENLISNSIQHNPHGCSINITLTEIRGKKVLVIADNGVGANDEIFKKLNRKNYDASQKLGEHGIGLRVVKQISAYHGWKISFESNDEHGFKTTVVL